MARIIQDRATGRRAQRSSPGMNSRQMVCKRRAWNRNGVSEIIGNILILAITVTLFSSIMWFVTSMPGPAEKVYTDFTSNTVPDFSAGTVSVSITNKGGEPLESDRTNIYLFVDSTPYTLHFLDGNISSSDWTTGQTWTYIVGPDKLTEGLLPSTSISVMIVDTAANTVVWTSPLMGSSQSGMNDPIIGDRGTDPASPSAGSSFQFYATVFDPYDSLDKTSVYIDATSIGLGNISLTGSGNNVFKSASYTANIAWNGAAVTVNAKDTGGNAVSPARLVLTILSASSGGGGDNPYQNYPGSLVNGTYPPDASGGNSGGSLGTTFYYIKNEKGEITRDFSPGEQVTIELWSDTIKNMAYGNTVNVIFPLTGQAISPQSSDLAFVAQQGFSTFYKYTYSFDAPAQSYTYTLQIQVKDNTGKSTNIADSINVGGKDYPSLTTYKLDDSTGKLIETSKFNITDTVYLLINTRDVDLSASTVLLGDLQIRDFSGTYIVQKSALPYTNPPTYDRPMSSLFKTDGMTNTSVTTSGGIYTLYLKLYEAYQGWWLPGTNTYTLSIDSLEDSGSGGTYGEKYSSVSCQFEVTAPVSTTDILASLGSGTFTWSASGAAWSDNRIVWYQGGNQWDSTEIDGDPGAGPLALALYDINGDGRDDAIVGSQSATSANIVWYENEAIDGSDWSDPRTIASPFDAYNPGKAADASTTPHSYGGRSWTGSTDTGNANEDATLWSGHDNVNMFVTSYNGVQYVCQNELVGQIAIADLDGDGDGDIVASFIHVVIYSTAESASDASSSNSWGMYFNRGIDVFWNDGKWTQTVLSTTNDWIKNDAANKDTNPSAGDIATGDFNQDGYPDIVAVYQDGTTKVWLNQWSALSGSLTNRESGAFGSSPMVLSGAMSVGGHTPWEHTTASEYQPLVRVADMDGNGYPDIIRTSTLDNNVYILYTEPTGSDTLTRVPTVEYNIDKSNAATVSGNGSLQVADDKYESLTETYVNYANQTLYATSSISPPDTTGSTIGRTYYNDGQLYDVSAGKTMSIGGFSPPSGYAGNAVSKATLQVSWTASGNYTGTAQLQYSTDGLTWHDLGLQPGGTGHMNIDLLALGVNTWDQLNTLRIGFVNPAGSGGTVSFDQIGLDVQFVKTCVLGYEWEIPNEHRAFHDLTMVAHVSGAEGFLIQYSVDNETWFNAFQVTSTTNTTQHLLLPYTPNDRYYIRAVDLNNGTTDNVKDTLSIDKLVINHYIQTVQWDSPYKVTSCTSRSPAITGLAVGDITKDAYGSLNDIVYSTASTAKGATLFIASQQAGSPKGTFIVSPVVTTALSTACADNVYDTKAVELGDIDGDGDLDIVLVVGYTFGQTTGSAPTLWVYYNNQAHDSNGWEFLEDPVNELGAESAINIQLGNIDLAVFLPLMGVVGIVAANMAVERISRRRKI